MQREELRRLAEAARLASGIGLHAAALLAVGGGIGIWADRSLGSAPWGLIVGLILGIIAAARSIYRRITRM